MGKKLIQECLHEDISKNLICKKCKEKFNVIFKKCSVSKCNEQTPIIIDKHNQIINQKMFYACENHNEDLKKAYIDMENWISKNNKEFAKILKESLQKKLKENKDKLH